MKKLIVYCAIFSAVIFITCCKKKEYAVRYPEDTEYTYISPPKRLCDKWWILDSISLNGKDYTDTVNFHVGEYSFFIKNEEIKISGTSLVKYKGSILTDKYFMPSSIDIFFSSPYTGFSIYPSDTPYKSDTVITYAPCLYHPYTGGWYITKLSNNILKINYTYKDTMIINYFKSK